VRRGFVMMVVVALAFLFTFFGEARSLAAPPSSTGSGWDLVFADEFSGTSVDTVKWNIASPSWTMPNSLSTASASQVSVGSGVLTLGATRPTSASSFSSGSVSTYQKNTFTSGYIEARILLPTTPGSWPAFWGLYTGWPPEADIMEFPLTTDGGTSGFPNTRYNTAFHYTNSTGSAASGAGPVQPTGSALNTGYHTFGMLWTSGTSVAYYFDGVQVSSFNNSAVAQMANMYLILDYAVGGWPGTPSTTQWPAGWSDQTKIDWVHVWQQRPGGASTASTWNINGDGSWTTSGNWSGIVPTYSGQQAIFGAVGSAATASVSWSNSLSAGGITFNGSANTTAYSLNGDALQLAGSGGTANAYVEALAGSQANQTINSRLELYNTTEFRNNMTGGQSIVLNGQLIGDGGLILNGAGTVQFSNNNTYVGDTSIGSGQGPAVARVTRSNPFGATGTVTIGPSGNATTARIEIQDGRTIPNTFNFCGRTNASIGIENINGNNTFSGTLSAQVGGSFYLIQSDAGLLTFSGSTTGANGIALRAITGSRTFTLQGAGDGAVGGIIDNGGGTVSITKAGAGTWTLSGANNYTGATTVSGGTLVVNGSLASGGALTSAAGTTLSGSGTIAATATINGSHSPGAGIGTQTFTGALTYGASARLSWALGGNAVTPGSFDSVAAGAVTITNGAAMDLILNSSGSTVDFTNAFWMYPQKWTVLAGTNISGSFVLGNISTDSAGRPVSSYGTFALQQSSTAVTLTFTPLTTVAPQQPTGLSTTLGNNRVILTWSAAGGADSYAVLRSTSNGGPYATLASGITSATYTDNSAANGTTYYYVVTATNSAGTSAASAQISAQPSTALTPYQTDAGTLVLFHFNEAAGGSVTANSGTLGGNAYSVNATTASATPPVVTTVLGATAASGLGNAAIFASGQLIGWDYNNSGAYDGDVSGASLSADSLPMSKLNMGNGGQTPWTIEALIYSTLVTLNTNQEIICTDSSAAARGFQFRINSTAQLELNLIANGTDIKTAVPTTGAHAYVPNTWYHVAASYDGTNIRLYWTRADSGATSANLISTTAANVGTTFGAAGGPLCIGGENRAANAEYFQGRIDEVRISNLARAATEMQPAYNNPWQSPSAAFLQDSVVTTAACLMPSTATYGRAINGISFQKQILQAFNGYQYTAWYDTNAAGTTQTVWLARRPVSGTNIGAWQAFNTGSTFVNGQASWDAHNVIALGICPVDGTLHMAWDHHDNTLRYRRSVPGLCTTNTGAWGAGMLNGEQNWLIASGQTVTDVTYPQFIATPAGGLTMDRRIGTSGDGDQLWQSYIPISGGSGGNWTNQTLFLSRSGTYQGSTSRNAYLNGFDYGPDGTIHVTWTWREGAGTSNHDICYAYSTDNGVTWRNNAGTVVADTSAGQSISVSTAGIVFKALDANQLLINQQAQTVDRDGRVHVLMLHRREDVGYAYPNVTTANFSTIGTAYYHYFRDPATGVWSQRRIPLDAYAVGSRPKIAYDLAGNVYAAYLSYSVTTVVTPGYTSGKLVMATASKASQYTDWRVVQVDNMIFNGEPLIDQARLLSDNVLSVYIQEDSATTGVVGTPLHVVDYFVMPSSSNPPTLSAIADQTVQYNTPTNPIALTVSDTDSPLSVVTISGSAADPTLIPTTNIVFSGSGASRTAVITPAAGASGPTTVTFVVSDGVASSAQTFNVTVLNVAQTWRQQNFGANWNNDSIAGDAADPDGDGVSNLLERALGLDPLAPSSGGLPVVGEQVIAGSSYLTITFTRSIAATDLTYTVEVSSDLAMWNSGSTYSSGGNTPGNSNTTEVSRTANGGVETIVVRDNTPIGATPGRFIHLKVSGAGG